MPLIVSVIVELALSRINETVRKRVWLAKAYGSFQSAWRRGPERNRDHLPLPGSTPLGRIGVLRQLLEVVEVVRYLEV